MFTTVRAYLPKMLVLAVLAIAGGTGVAWAGTAAPPNDRPEFGCASGEFCTWSGELYGETMTRFDLRTVNPEECFALPEGAVANSFANRLDRDVTIYQDAKCSTEGDFITYPGHDTFVPKSPFVVRAIKIWE